MSSDPFNPFNQGKGTAEVRKLISQSARAPKEFELERQIRELQRKRRRELLRRLFRR